MSQDAFQSPWLTTSEAAFVTKRSVDTLQELVRLGRMRTWSAGRPRYLLRLSKVAVAAAILLVLAMMLPAFAAPGIRVRLLAGDGAERIGEGPTIGASPNGTAVGTTPLHRRLQRRFRVPASIDPTGTRDVARALTRFIASVPNNSTILFPSGARYRIDGQVTVRGRSGLVIDGNGSKFFRATDGTAQKLRLWQFDLDSNMVFRNATIVGLNGGGNLKWSRVYEHGIALYGITDFTIARVRVVRTWGDGVVIQHGDVITPTSTTRIYPNNVTVRNSYFNRNGRAGISVITGSNISILDNRILRAAVNLINLEPDADDQVIDGVTISGNRFNVTSTVGGLMVASNGTCQVNNVTITGNTQIGHQSTLTIWSRPLVRPSCTVRASGWRIENNTFMAGGGGVNPYVIRFDHRDDVTISNNSFYFSGTAPGYEVGLFDVNQGWVSGSTKSGPGAGSNEPLFVDAASTNIWLDGVQVA